MRMPVLLALLLVPTAALAQPAQRIDVALSSFKFTPDTLRLHHGEHYLLRLTNTNGGGHDFVAKSFFAAAHLSPAMRERAPEGAVDVDGHSSVEIELTAPAAGTYEVHCSHFMHSTFGMKGRIVVD